VVDTFPTMDQSLDLASNLARTIGELQVKTTTSQIDWSLNGLSLIGDADEKYRHDNS
jgi:predicted Zn-dependent protease